MFMNEDVRLKGDDQTPTWIQNPHGVKSCWPLSIARENVEKKVGWKYCDPEEVPAQKQYPLGMGELTAAGLNRRMAAQESVRISRTRPVEEKMEEVKQMSKEDVRGTAKRLGISKYWIKSEARLLKEIEDLSK